MSAAHDETRNDPTERVTIHLFDCFVIVQSDYEEEMLTRA